MSLKSINSIFIKLAICIVSTVSNMAHSSERNQMRMFELKHPRCESQTLIETGKESFTTIANDLPGRTEYNELVKTFHQGQWEKLDQGMESFQSVFEDSPLREAVAFLRVESLFDRIDSSESPITVEAEKALRETLLLYPRSKLVPIIQATVGAFWLRNGLYAKSLALFVRAKEEYPFHSLSCLFQFGIGENNLLLHENEAATRSFKALIQKCNNPRLVTGATLRLIEMASDKSPKESAKKLEAIYQSESNIISRFYPEALYNIGENKYQKGEWVSAKFFLNEYLHNKRRDLFCSSYAQKRLADVAAKQKQPVQEVTGLYLTAYDQYPNTDIGKFSYVQAMLLAYPEKGRGEQERRTKVIDEKMAAIQDLNLRRLVAMNKGLALLEAGEKGAATYLVNATKSNPELLKTPEMADFVSSRLLKILKKESLATLREETNKESYKNEDLFTPFEESYGLWFKGSNYEKEAKSFYVDLVEKRFAELGQKGKWGWGFELIEHWKQTDMWSNQDPPVSIKVSMGKILLDYLINQNPDKVNEIYKEVAENEELLAPFLGGDFYPIFLGTYLHTKDSSGISQWMKKTQSARQIASVQSGLSIEEREFMVMKKAEALMYLKKFKESNELLKKISSKKFKDSAILLRIQALQNTKQYSEAYKIGQSNLSKIKDKESKSRVLASLVPIVNSAKMWVKAESLLQEAKKNKIEGKSLAPYLYMAGKAQSEEKNCKKTITYLSQAISIDVENSMANEAKFRLGKCYLKEKQKDLAKKHWQEVAESKDSFWAPLAKSEINLMEEP
jgi:tetratricopeptide (TPR) repeat protein